MKFQPFHLIPTWGRSKKQEYAGQNQKFSFRSLSAMFALGAFLGLAIATTTSNSENATAAYPIAANLSADTFYSIGVIPTKVNVKLLWDGSFTNAINQCK